MVLLLSVRYDGIYIFFCYCFSCDSMATEERAQMEGVSGLHQQQWSSNNMIKKNLHENFIFHLFNMWEKRISGLNTRPPPLRLDNCAGEFPLELKFWRWKMYAFHFPPPSIKLGCEWEKMFFIHQKKCTSAGLRFKLFSRTYCVQHTSVVDVLLLLVQSSLHSAMLDALNLILVGLNDWCKPNVIWWIQRAANVCVRLEKFDVKYFSPEFCHACINVSCRALDETTFTLGWSLSWLLMRPRERVSESARLVRAQRENLHILILIMCSRQVVTKEKKSWRESERAVEKKLFKLICQKCVVIKMYEKEKLFISPRKRGALSPGLLSSFECTRESFHIGNNNIRSSDGGERASNWKELTSSSTYRSLSSTHIVCILFGEWSKSSS